MQSCSRVYTLMYNPAMTERVGGYQNTLYSVSEPVEGCEDPSIQTQTGNIYEATGISILLLRCKTYPFPRSASNQNFNRFQHFKGGLNYIYYIYVDTPELLDGSLLPNVEV